MQDFYGDTPFIIGNKKQKGILLFTAKKFFDICDNKLRIIITNMARTLGMG